MYSVRMLPQAGPTPGFLVWRLSMKWRAAVDRALTPLEITHAHYSLLSSLLGMHALGHAPSQRELSDHTGLEALYVSKLARALEGRELIVRQRHPADPRAWQLRLTEHGEHVTRSAIQTVRTLMDQLLAPLGGLDGDRTAALVADLIALLDLADIHRPLATLEQQ